jgi:hypothetical protein
MKFDFGLRARYLQFPFEYFGGLRARLNLYFGFVGGLCARM